MSNNHARLSPSNHRWVHCSGSVREEEIYPNTSSPAAVEGTGTHLLLELCITKIKSPIDYLNKTISDDDHKWIISLQQVKRVEVCLHYIDSVRSKLKTDKDIKHITLKAEQKSDPGKFYKRDDWHGTCDVTITGYDSNGDVLYLEVIDYKDGFIKVEVGNNPQLIAYLWGQSHHLRNFVRNDNKTYPKLVMTIVQPKRESDPISSQEFNYKDLKMLADDLFIKALATDDPNAALISGDHCRWCKHKENCKTLKNEKLEVIEIMDEGGLIKKVHNELETMPDDTLAQILESEKVFEDAFIKVKLEASRRLKLGQLIPGYYIGKGNSKKVWNEDPEIISGKLKNMKVKKEDIFPSKLLSPAQALKLDLPKRAMNNLNKLISIVDGKPILKKGEAKVITPEELFGDLPEINQPKMDQKPIEPTPDNDSPELLLFL